MIDVHTKTNLQYLSALVVSLVCRLREVGPSALRIYRGFLMLRRRLSFPNTLYRRCEKRVVLCGERFVLLTDTIAAYQ